jgi:LPS export ABC transporter protein LptC
MKQQKHGRKNNFIRKIKTHLSIVILCMGIAVLFFSCTNDLKTIEAYSADEKRPAVTAEGFEMIHSDSTVIRYKMKTPELIRFEDDNDPFMEFPQGILIEQFDSKMQITSSISSNYARYYEKERKWIAKNNVVAVNAQNDTLKTEELIREEGKGKIYSEQFVKIIRKDQILTGIGFESDEQMTNWKIKKPKGTLYVEVEE